MYRFYIAITAVVAISVAVAQGPQNKGKDGMMGGGMGMMGMMPDPVHQSVATAFALPQMQAELGLSTQQVAQLGQYKQELLTKGQELSTQILARQKELAALVAAEGSKNAEVKQLLEQVASFRAQLEFAAYETAGKMKASLTDQQRTKLAALKPGELHRTMMAHMTVAEMAQMMQFMGGDAGVLRRGMMGMMDGMMGMPSPPKL